MLKLPVPTELIEGESLIGFIARACDRNGHPSIRNVLRLAGISKEKLIFESANIDIDRTAQFFGCSPGNFRERLDFNIANNGERGMVDVLGSPVRKHLRDGTMRRLSPESLRKSPHHRAIWLLKPLLFCPESGELLIHRCPNPTCARSLGWIRTNGIGYCEHCLDEDAAPRTDLREMQTPRLSGAEFDDYKSITQLITNPNEVAARIPATFESWKPWEVFDLIVLISTMLVRRTESCRRIQKIAAMQQNNWHENFMRAGRAALTWPQGFYDIIETQEKIAGKRAHQAIWSTTHNLVRRFNASAKANSLIESTMNEFLVGRGSLSPFGVPSPSGEWMPIKQALNKYGLAMKWVRHLSRSGDLEVRHVRKKIGFPQTYLNCAQLESIAKERHDLVPLTSLSGETGLPMSVLMGLCSSMHVELETGRVASLLLPSVSQREAARFRDSLTCRASHAISGQVQLLSELRRRGAGDYLLAVIRQCLDGGLRFSVRTGSQPTLSSIMVLSEELTPILSAQLPNICNLPDKMTRRDAAIFLGVIPHNISALVRPGYLREAPGCRRRYVSGDSVKDFASKFISSRMVAKHLGTSVRAVGREMKTRKIRAALSYSAGNRAQSYIWRRADLTFLPDLPS